jgi:hypothetical protein
MINISAVATRTARAGGAASGCLTFPPIVQFLFAQSQVRPTVRFMARLARIVVRGVAHHVTQRGNRREPRFLRTG